MPQRPASANVRGRSPASAGPPVGRWRCGIDDAAGGKGTEPVAGGVTVCAALAPGSHTPRGGLRLDLHFAASPAPAPAQTVTPPANRFRTLAPAASSIPATPPARRAGRRSPATCRARSRSPAVAASRRRRGRLSANLTVRRPSADGNLRAYAADTPEPPTSALNFRAGQVRANNAVLPVAQDGSAGRHPPRRHGRRLGPPGGGRQRLLWP